MDSQEILSEILKTINALQTLTIAASAARPWTATLPCSVAGESLILEIPASFPSSILIKRPRVSFCTAPDPAGKEAHGSGIARIAESKGKFRITVVPYRFQLNDPASGPEGVTIERRQNSWQRRTERPEKQGLGFWLRAMRSVSFPLSILPICIGTVLAAVNGPTGWLLFALALAGGVAAHAATNLISDYFDFVKGTDTTNALSSHTGVLVDELIDPSGILLASMACFMITAFSGGVLAAMTGWRILFFGLAGMLGGFAYTGGPIAWKYLGLGEFSTGFLMGPLMTLGAYFVQTGTVSVTAVLLSLAIGMLVSAVSFGNNIRDAFFDREAGITTMPVKMGAPAALGMFRTLLIAPYALVALAVFIDNRLYPLTAAVITLPLAVSIFRSMKRRGKATLEGLSDQAIRVVLPLKTIGLHFRFCILLVLGCGVAVFFR